MHKEIHDDKMKRFIEHTQILRDPNHVNEEKKGNRGEYKVTISPARGH